jgi:hypothetical protein
MNVINVKLNSVRHIFMNFIREQLSHRQLKSFNESFRVIQPSHFLKMNTCVVGRFVKMFDFGQRMNHLTLFHLTF